MEKLCANCGKAIPEGSDPRRMYCDKVCKRESNNLDLQRSVQLMALAQVWYANRHAKKGSEEAELSSYARGQMGQLLARYNREDKARGRDQGRLVKPRFERGELVIDKEPKPKLPAVIVNSRAAKRRAAEEAARLSA